MGGLTNNEQRCDVDVKNVDDRGDLYQVMCQVDVKGMTTCKTYEAYKVYLAGWVELIGFIHRMR